MKLAVAAVASTIVLFPFYSAHALPQSKHAVITEEVCERAGLPHDFCQRVADENYNTDVFEFEVLEAHSQPGDGQTHCESARSVVDRQRLLGSEFRAKLRAFVAAPSYDAAAEVAGPLGRALHGVQDNCAHNGMINPQHAWGSVSDVCEGTTISPDAQPEAEDCAWYETELIFEAVAAAVEELEVGYDYLQPWEAWRRWPGQSGVCDFLASAGDWDGADTRWNNDVMRRVIREQLRGAILNDDAPIVPICERGEAELARPANAVADDVDVSAGPASCLKITAYCRGKADGAAGPPPWVEDEEEAAASGCTVAPGSSGNATGLFLVGAVFFGLVALRRRAR